MSTITLTIDGKEVKAKQGATVLEAAREANIYIPTLCYEPALKPYGGCRLCIVEIDNVRGLPTSCTTPATDGMVVHTETAEINQVRRVTVELLIANHPADCLTCSQNQQCELQRIAAYLGIEEERLGRLRKTDMVLPIDTSHPAFDRDPNKCILCGRCVRACHYLQVVGAIDFAYRGYSSKVATFGNRPLIESICQSCGECVARCPTGALTPKKVQSPTYEVKTICPYCGVGCGMYLGVRGNEIVRVRGDIENEVNRGSLCVKGRFGYDFVNHPERLTTPLIRREGRPKSIVAKVSGNGHLKDLFREATWEEALEVVAKKLTTIKRNYGADSIAALSSAKYTNEENYVMQKFVRTVVGTNNIDHCARLCHASTVAAALSAFGEGAMSNSITDFSKAEVLFVIGSNTTECHPIIGAALKRAAKYGGGKLIVADVRRIELSEYATVHLQHRPGSDVALLNGLMRVIIQEGLHDKEFIEERTEGFAELAEVVSRYTPEVVEEITGVPQADIVEAARLFGKAERACILYGMGITQHVTGTDNVKSIANLLMLTGNMGREGSGFSPLRGQNNVQGACDMGALPNVYPGYQRVDNPEVRRKFEAAWGHELSDKPGLTLTEMFQAAYQGRIKALYIAGENPMMSEPSVAHARRALERLEFLVVQDIFPTETAMLADVILPVASFAEKDGTFTNTERRVQRGRKALMPPGEAREDWEIISALAEKMGGSFNYGSAAEIMEEIASLTPIYGGINYSRLEDQGLQWPCPDASHPGTPILHKDNFARGLGKFHGVEYSPPAEDVSTEYPLILTTGRVLEHWHTGSMSRRSPILNALHSNGCVELHPKDAAGLGLIEGDLLAITSERGKVEAPLHITDKSAPGVAFMSFHWREAPANVLTNTAIDPVAKIPEFKISAVKAVLAVLERAAEDNEFLARLADNPSEALRDYDLTPEERAALASGDIQKIESWVGKLDERLAGWLRARLAQERW